jgi:glycosyl hydrolase family 26
MRKQIRALGVATGAALAALGLSLSPALPAAAAAARTAPKATLGIWISAEDSGKYSTVPGQHPNIANYYLAWGQAFPRAFIKAAAAHGATPYIEIEPWHAGPSWNKTPSMVSIGKNTSADCGRNGTSSCLPWLDSVGKDVASFGHRVIFTFAHEFNVSGQYPWSAGDSEHTTPAQWIKAWDTVQADINGHRASQNAWWMWAPNADTGGTTHPFGPWWPGQRHVGMVGVDGYPQPQYGLDTFGQVFGKSFTEMKALTKLPVFISETDLAPETGSGGTQTVTRFVKAALAAGATGLLQFQDGTPGLTSKQWSELDAALGMPQN